MPSSIADAPAPPGLPPNAAAIRQLILSGAYPLAEAEVRYAQRRFTPTPALEATRAWLLQARGEYRPAINSMKRAYPQYMTREGDQLPLDAKRVIFPLDYWPLIERHASARSLDPYLIAALVAQESTFDPAVRSAANAYGLMQIVPATGKRLARSLGIRRFTTGKLTDPETNVKLGTFYFKGLVNQFGGAHFALASYNAGENRVERWIAERGPLPQDEFIDDIPFPETQLYVKKILGTAEDYRQLYKERRANAN
jgi:soluble lytic murein transglycosylase